MTHSAPQSIFDLKLAVVGLGYVGLPLAVEFGKKFPLIGFDINISRIEELKKGIDKTLEVTDKEIKQASLIIGLKSHLQQNQKLQALAKKKNIPIYKVTRKSVYQVVKLIQFIML